MYVSNIEFIVLVEDVLRLLLELLCRRLGGHFVKDLCVGGEELDVVVAVLDLGPIDGRAVLRGDAIVDESAFGGADEADNWLYQLFVVPPTPGNI